MKLQSRIEFLIKFEKTILEMHSAETVFGVSWTYYMQLITKIRHYGLVAEWKNKLRYSSI